MEREKRVCEKMNIKKNKHPVSFPVMPKEKSDKHLPSRQPSPARFAENNPDEKK
jgi:hypothetical protein